MLQVPPGFKIWVNKHLHATKVLRKAGVSNILSILEYAVLVWAALVDYLVNKLNY